MIHSIFWGEDSKLQLLRSNRRSILHDMKLRKNQNCVLENIILLSPWKCFIRFVSRRIFNSATCFSFCVMFMSLRNKSRYSSNYYYNLPVFFKLKISIFCVEPEFLRSETIHIIKKIAVKHFFPVTTQRYFNDPEASQTTLQLRLVDVWNNFLLPLS